MGPQLELRHSATIHGCPKQHHDLYVKSLLLLLHVRSRHSQNPVYLYQPIAHEYQIRLSDCFKLLSENKHHKNCSLVRIRDELMGIVAQADLSRKDPESAGAP